MEHADTDFGCSDVPAGYELDCQQLRYTGKQSVDGCVWQQIRAYVSDQNMQTRVPGVPNYRSCTAGKPISTLPPTGPTQCTSRRTPAAHVELLLAPGRSALHPDPATLAGHRNGHHRADGIRHHRVLPRVLCRVSVRVDGEQYEDRPGDVLSGFPAGFPRARRHGPHLLRRLSGGRRVLLHTDLFTCCAAPRRAVPCRPSERM